MAISGENLEKKPLRFSRSLLCRSPFCQQKDLVTEWVGEIFGQAVCGVGRPAHSAVCTARVPRYLTALPESRRSQSLTRAPPSYCTLKLPRGFFPFGAQPTARMSPLGEKAMHFPSVSMGMDSNS